VSAAGDLLSPKNYNTQNNKWYRDRVATKTTNVEVLSSGNEERREKRFQIHHELGIESGDAILDIGCGFGDFLDHLEHRGIDVDYTGVDIMPEFIQNAIATHPKAKFELRDFLEEKFEAQSFDYVICSQVLNLKIDGLDVKALVQKFLEEMFRLARKGISCDFVTNYVDYQEAYLTYHSPEEVFAVCKKISKRVVLRHDYPLYEFCVYVYPDFAGWAS
jgi:ubiquinone/menaquinone biosynthesis C-methylase UbiE